VGSLPYCLVGGVRRVLSVSGKIPKKMHEHKSHHISTSFASIMKQVGALELSQKIGPKASQNAQYKRVWIV
jgi:hypothetical protein